MLNKILCCVALLAPMTGAADVYDCKTTNFGQGGWVGERIVLDFDPKTGKAKAIDAAIKQVHDKFIPVSLKPRSDTSYTFRWTLQGVKGSGNETVKISYKVNLFTAKNKFTLSARLHGYDNIISGSGTCKQTK